MQPSEPPAPPIGPWVAGALVFGSSGAVLVVELASLRLLAPYLGLTLETNTLVIGLALAAIAAGAWLGVGQPTGSRPVPSSGRCSPSRAGRWRCCRRSSAPPGARMAQVLSSR